MKIRSMTALAVVSMLVFAAGPASGADKSGTLDELHASDAEVVKAIADLDRQVNEQQNEVAAARQAFDAAQQSIIATELRLQSTKQRIDGLRDVVMQRAIEQYMQPDDDQVAQLLAADGFAEASRRDELLREISDLDSDALDQLRAARVDLDSERKAAADAQKLAESRRVAAEKKLVELRAARAEKGRAEQVLKDRIDAASLEDGASAFSIGRASRGGDVLDDGRVSAAGLKWPIRGSHPVTSGFGSRWGRQHAGIDVGIPIGTPIYSAKDGRVTFAGQSQGYGTFVCVQHDGSFQTCYGHLSRILVSNGQSVSADTRIALSGNSGRSTGAHLHFETCVSSGQPACYFNKNYRNPLSFLP